MKKLVIKDSSAYLSFVAETYPMQPEQLDWATRLVKASLGGSLYRVLVGEGAHLGSFITNQAVREDGEVYRLSIPLSETSFWEVEGEEEKEVQPQQGG